MFNPDTAPDGGLYYLYLFETAARSIKLASVTVHGHDVGAGLIYQDINIKVSAVQNSHFDFHKGPASGKHKSYSYRFETPDRVIVFTGDTGASDAHRTRQGCRSARHGNLFVRRTDEESFTPTLAACGIAKIAKPTGSKL
jgi:hypothetical protein